MLNRNRRTNTVATIATLAALTVSATWVSAKEYSNAQATILGHLAAAAIAKDRCPTIKISETAAAMLLTSARLDVSDMTSQPTMAMAKVWALFANDKGRTFCKEIWDAYGPDGSVMPMLLYGKVP